MAEIAPSERMKAVLALARRMRSAIELLAPEFRPFNMKSFPKSACGDTCLLLGTYLADKGYDTFRTDCGDRGRQEDRNFSSHAWLSDDSLIVDITADQFGDGPGPVVVAVQSAWHSTFELGKSRTCNLRDYSEQSVYPLIGTYYKLRPWLFDDSDHSK